MEKDFCNNAVALPDWATSWLTLPETAEILKPIYSAFKLRRGANAGALPFRCARFNNRWYFVKDEVESFKKNFDLNKPGHENK